MLFDPEHFKLGVSLKLVLDQMIHLLHILIRYLSLWCSIFDVEPLSCELNNTELKSEIKKTPQ